MTSKLNLSLLLQLGIDRASVEALRRIEAKVGTADGGPSIQDGVMQFEEYASSSTEAQQALREIGDLRSEVQSFQTSIKSLQSTIEELAAQVAGLPNVDLFRNRIENIEDRLA